MARTRLEYAKGSSKKFWEVDVAGAAFTVRWGRIGTAGQDKSWRRGSPAIARAEVDKLIAAKQKKGYAKAGAGAAKAAARPSLDKAAQPVGLYKESDGSILAFYRDGKDVWFVEVDEYSDGIEALLAGGALRDAVADEGVERWRFARPADAERAAKWIAANVGEKRATLKGDVSADFAAWNKRAKQTRDRIGKLAVVRTGPITLQVDDLHVWIFPRPPSTSWLSGRVMVPVASIVGPLDPRFGKRTGVYISACPDPDEDQALEMVVQDPARPSPVDAYFLARGSFWTVHQSMQVETIGTSARWCVTEHSGEQGTPGFYRTRHFRTRREAEKVYAERVSELDKGHAYTRVGPNRMGPWYRRALMEIHLHTRVKAARQRRFKLAVVTAPFQHSVAGSYGLPSTRMFRSGLGDLGGAPNFCQDNWDHQPPNAGKAVQLHVMSWGGGDPGWTQILNDGDLGTFNFFAAPGEPFGTIAFACH